MSPTVVVGMSGGVDSSVSALLLKQQGYQVIGMFMKNWDDRRDASGSCQATEDFEDVMRVCEILDIPYYSIDFIQEYWDKVFTTFLNDYQAGYTPNPDILCNKEIKFQAFMEKALDLGADYLATGHYCQLRRMEDSKFSLLRGRDEQKDQSYFLYTLKSSQLAKVLFPIGHLTKTEVRQLAEKHHLHTHSKKDSTGICFIGERKFSQFLSQYLSPRPGNFLSLAGEVVGQHEGQAFYTIGQRKGLGLGGAGEAWYVVGKDPEKNHVYVERGDKHPSLYADYLKAREVTWVSSEPPTGPFPIFCTAKIRYRQKDQSCLIEKIGDDGELFVSFPSPQRAITLKQSIVFYQGDFCLGGGTIESIGPSYYHQNKSLPPSFFNEWAL